MTSPQSITVGLLWHSLVSGNLGVGALTESNIAIIREVAERQGKRVRFLVLGSGEGCPASLRAELEAAGHAIETHRVRVFRGSFRKLVRRCDLVVDIGEGDSFADIYGFKRFFFLWLSKNIVCSLGVPLILAPQTIGPFEGRLARLLACQVMRRCHKVFARDHLSSAYLRQIGITANTAEAVDVAFRLPFKPSLPPAPDGKLRVGINVSGLLFNGGYTGGNQFGLSVDYPVLVRKLIAHFLAQPGVELHLVGHVIEPHMPVEDDLRVCRQLAEEFPGCIVAPHFERPSEAKSYIASLDFFTGARMHACIAAFSSGVPVVPMAYSRKFNGLFGSLGYEAIADMKARTNVETLHVISVGFEQLLPLADLARKGKAVAAERLQAYEAVLTHFMAAQP